MSPFDDRRGVPPRWFWRFVIVVLVLAGSAGWTAGCKSGQAPAPTQGSGMPTLGPEGPSESGAGQGNAAATPGTGGGTGAQTEGPTEVAPATSQPTEAADDEAAEQPRLDDLELDLAAMTYDEELELFVVPLGDGLRAVLTLDPTLQMHLDEVVERYDEPAEAIVAIEPATGRVLAFVEDHNERVEAEHPAASAEPWAASVFKIVSATILVEERNLGLARRMCVPPGRGELQEEDLVADEARDTRCVDFTEAMAESVNAYFGRLFVDQLSPELIDAWLLRFGFNEAIPFEIEVAPSAAEVPAQHLERARMGAGFRHARLSPLHGALIVASIANGGVMMRPRLVDRLLDAEGEVVVEAQPETWRRVMSDETARTMTRAMSQTTVTGTAARYFANRDGWPEDLGVAGKTGTLSNRSADEPDPDPLLIFSWFAGFAPIDGASIAVAGVVYNGERWYIKGSYLASEAIIQYLRR